MKVIQRGIAPDGTKIQREEWHETNNFIPFGSTVAAYPIAKENGTGVLEYPEKGRIFRVDFQFENEEEAKKCFIQLLNGEKSLKDFFVFLYRPADANFI